MRIRPTRIRRNTAPNHGCDECVEEEEEEEEIVFTRENRRRWKWSLLVKVEGGPLNTQHAQHRPVQATDR